MSISSETTIPTPKRISFGRIFTLILTAIAVFFALILPIVLRPDALPLAVGDVAPRDLQAPYAIEYISEVRTEDARENAATAVAQVYTAADPSIAREQIESLRGALVYIATVRSDEYAVPNEKLSDLISIEDITLKEDSIEAILLLGNAEWERIQQESLSVLEQVMRNNIRQGNLVSTQRNLSSLVSLALTESQAQIVTELVSAFVVPNSLYSDDLTEASRKSASEAVEPVIKRYKAGESVISGGQVISSADLEALEKLGLVQTQEGWMVHLSSGLIILALAIFLWFYFSRRPSILLKNIKNLLSTVIVFLIFLVGARLAIPDNTIIPYLLPIPAFGLLMATLFGADVAFVLSFSLSLLVTFGLSNTLDLTIYYLLSSLVSIMVLGRAQQVWSFLRAGMSIAFIGMATLLAYWFSFSTTAWNEIAILIAAATFNGIASASLTLLLQFVLAQILGLTTTLRLLEISRPDAPLLQLLLRTAPGTYQHSLQVANLSEQAAKKIGADALLVRVGALFHDVGKAENPHFFIENQTPGHINTHEDLAPEESAAIIIRHVTDGARLGKKHRLPKRLIDFILEHHGTQVTRYQYTQALENTDGDISQVDIKNFQYPGPAPRSRETALLMLADGTEAITRAEGPQTEAELRTLVHKIFDSVQKSGQLKNTPLTLRDLSIINESFVATLRGMLHPRVKYPKRKNLSASRGVPTIPRQKKND
ncbi:MAG: HDIG domain-containing protein [Chloroflexi bacterium]|nr:HDIG domain-containing protein [Chloroflexota bacterium]